MLKTLGRDGWHTLKDTYNLLVKDGQYKVRRSLSFSLHEIAKILGTELTESELLGVMEGFLKDLEDVRTLCSFLLIRLSIKRGYPLR